MAWSRNEIKGLRQSDIRSDRASWHRRYENRPPKVIPAPEKTKRHTQRQENFSPSTFSPREEAEKKLAALGLK